MKANTNRKQYGSYLNVILLPLFLLGILFFFKSDFYASLPEATQFKIGNVLGYMIIIMLPILIIGKIYIIYVLQKDLRKRHKETLN